VPRSTCAGAAPCAVTSPVSTDGAPPAARGRARDPESRARPWQRGRTWLRRRSDRPSRSALKRPKGSTFHRTERGGRDTAFERWHVGDAAGRSARARPPARRPGGRWSPTARGAARAVARPLATTPGAQRGGRAAGGGAAEGAARSPHGKWRATTPRARRWRSPAHVRLRSGRARAGPSPFCRRVRSAGATTRSQCASPAACQSTDRTTVHRSVSARRRASPAPAIRPIPVARARRPSDRRRATPNRVATSVGGGRQPARGVRFAAARPRPTPPAGRAVPRGGWSGARRRAHRRQGLGRWPAPRRTRRSDWPRPPNGPPAERGRVVERERVPRRHGSEEPRRAPSQQQAGAPAWVVGRRARPPWAGADRTPRGRCTMGATVLRSPGPSKPRRYARAGRRGPAPSSAVRRGRTKASRRSGSVGPTGGQRGHPGRRPRTRPFGPPEELRNTKAAGARARARARPPRR
jgi:hypothetical protein